MSCRLWIGSLSSLPLARALWPGASAMAYSGEKLKPCRPRPRSSRKTSASAEPSSTASLKSGILSRLARFLSLTSLSLLIGCETVGERLELAGECVVNPAERTISYHRDRDGQVHYRRLDCCGDGCRESEE